MIYNCHQGSELWYEVRAGKFTGTIFKALFMGESTKGFREAIADTVSADILQTATPSKDLDFIEAVARGKALEDYARRDFEEITGREIREVGFVSHYDDFLKDWVGISPDGVEIIDGEIYMGLEIKCPEPKAHLLYLTGGVLPKEYFYQVHGAMYVTKADYWHFMSYHPDLKPFILKVMRDEDVITKIDDRVRIGIDMAKEMIKNYDSYEYQ